MNSFAHLYTMDMLGGEYRSIGYAVIWVGSVGAIFFQYPIGWLADRTDRGWLLVACVATVVVMIALLPWLIQAGTEPWWTPLPGEPGSPTPPRCRSWSTWSRVRDSSVFSMPSSRWGKGSEPRRPSNAPPGTRFASCAKRGENPSPGLTCTRQIGNPNYGVGQYALWPPGGSSAW